MHEAGKPAFTTLENALKTTSDCCYWKTVSESLSLHLETRTRLAVGKVLAKHHLIFACVDQAYSIISALGSYSS